MRLAIIRLRMALCLIQRFLRYHYRIVRKILSGEVELKGFELIETVVALLLIQLGVHQSHLSDPRKAILNLFKFEKDGMSSLDLGLIGPHSLPIFFLV